MNNYGYDDNNYYVQLTHEYEACIATNLRYYYK